MRIRTSVLACAILTHATLAIAQDAAGSTDEPTANPVEPSATDDTSAAAPEPTPEPEPPEAQPAAPSPSETAAASSIPSAAPIKVDAPADAAKPSEVPSPELWTGSNIRRLRLMPDSLLVVDSPLTTDLQTRDYLQARRQVGGIAPPDTTAALGHSKYGGPNTDLLELRLQPTLILLNGRRLVSAPYSRSGGADYVDVNQIPLMLIERVETTRGMASALYGDGAVGGVVNFITRRNYQGVEVEMGGQASGKFDQSDQDISLTLGAGNEKNGMNATVSYFNRLPLAATDRDWIGQRNERIESLLGSPSSFQQQTNFNYPFPDPFCDVAIGAGHASSIQTRLRGYGPPTTLGLLPPDIRQRFLMDHDVARGNSNGVIDPLETATYCATNFTPQQDLILKDQRIQAHTTFWHKFGDHAEGFGELGYYRTDNQNRTAASFPMDRVSPDEIGTTPDWVPTNHADQPVSERGFSAVEVANGRVANNQYLVGRVAGLSAGSNVNKRSADVFRAVLGLKGDLKAAPEGSVLRSWDWELAGLFSASSAVSTVPDVLLDKLADALRSCAATKDVERLPVNRTIKERQESGCYNPFYSSVTNNAALNPLGITGRSGGTGPFVTSDSDLPGKKGYGVQDGGYICDPNDPNSPPCPAQFDRNGDGIYELAGTPNTQQVMNRIMGEQMTVQRRTLSTVDGALRGDLAKFMGGGLSFALGGQYRRESTNVDYDHAYNQKLYGFLFGGPDVPTVSRTIAAGFAELRLSALKGTFELQPAVRVEHYETVGTAVNPLIGLAIRPFASADKPAAALEYLVLRGQFGRGHRAPSLMQMYGSQATYQQVEFNGSTVFIPQLYSGNPKLDFEKYTTLSGGLQWDFAGLHVGGDFWNTKITDVIGADNAQTLVHDCQALYDLGSGDCPEQVLMSGTRSLDHLESKFANLGEVNTNGLDGSASYTLDSKKTGLGTFGAFMLGVQGTFVNSYMIKSARALREYYRDGGGLPQAKSDGTRDYSKLNAEYEAAGYRNLDNFAPPMPRLRFSVPLRWMYLGHILGVTMRYIGSYQDDSENTIERYGLQPSCVAKQVGVDPGACTYGNGLAVSEGEKIPAWMVFDANYGYTFVGEGWKIKLSLGVINLFDRAPPAVESPLGYEIGVHDPRGRMFYARLNGAF